MNQQQETKTTLTVDRIDFTETPAGVLVNKIATKVERIRPRDIVLESSLNTVMALEEMLTWCEQRGWAVRRWHGGARAFKHGLRPVRSAGQIHALRQRLSEHPRPELNAHTLDLRYDL